MDSKRISNNPDGSGSTHSFIDLSCFARVFATLKVANGPLAGVAIGQVKPEQTARRRLFM
jgi:hypothetical protein